MSTSERTKAAIVELDKESAKSLGESLVDSSKSEASSLTIQAIPESPTAVPVSERKLSSSQEEYFQDFNSAKVVADYVSELLRNGMKGVAVMATNGELKDTKNENKSKNEIMTNEISKETHATSKTQNHNSKDIGELRGSFNGDAFVSDCVNTAKSNVAHKRAYEEEEEE